MKNWIFMARSATFKYLIPIVLFCFGFSCRPDPSIPITPLQPKTKNVVIVVMDGSRYTENFGDPNRENIPGLDQLSKKGILCTNFYCTGQTYTIPGHISLSTGVDEGLLNNGSQTPTYASVFQVYREQTGAPATDAWIIASKDKIESLDDCLDLKYKGLYSPSTDCGVSGMYSGYRDDSITFAHCLDTMSKYLPRLTLVSFAEPDVGGHSNNWLTYLQATQKTDNYILQLWNFLQSHPNYKGTTTMFVTNDHGRHTDGVSGGFSGHGDNCQGCRHLFLLALGPDFPDGTTNHHPYSLVDVAPTIAKLLRFKMHPYAQGKVMSTLFPPENY